MVAIDGTAGSGKSTTARQAARELGFLFLDTGAMYRAVTLKVIRQKVDLNDQARLKALLGDTRIDFQSSVGEKSRVKSQKSEVESQESGVESRVMMDGEDVSEAIRAPEVDKLVSHVSVIPIVRQRLVAEQRRIALGKNIVCEGRDIGSVVFPDADVKFYMEASLPARAERRQKEMRGKGVSVPESSILNNLSERDYIDSTRAHSPLTRVSDAIAIDTTNITIAEEVMIVVNLVRMRMK